MDDSNDRDRPSPFESASGPIRSLSLANSDPDPNVEPSRSECDAHITRTSGDLEAQAESAMGGESDQGEEEDDKGEDDDDSSEDEDSLNEDVDMNEVKGQKSDDGSGSSDDEMETSKDLADGDLPPIEPVSGADHRGSAFFAYTCRPLHVVLKTASQR